VSDARIPERPDSTLRERRIAEAATLIVMGFWAGNFIVVKSAVEVLPPVGFTFLRFSIAAVLLLAILRWREGSVGLPRRDAISILGLGVIGFGVYQVLWTVGIQTISAGDSALLIASTPIFVALIAVAARADTLTPAKLAGALVSFGGVALVISSGPGLRLGASFVGAAITLLAAACWATYTAFGAPFLRRHSPLRTTTWAVIAGSVAMAPIGVAQLARVDIVAVPPEAWWGVLYSATLAAGIANVVVFHAVRLLGPTRITAFQSLVPAFAVVLAAIVLAEPILPGQVVGGAIIVAGVWLTRRDALPTRPMRLRRPMTGRS
jgi:drug/metabolite transporter (DMT)-like permease